MKSSSEVWNGITFDTGLVELRDYLESGGEMYFEDEFNKWSFLHITCHVFNVNVIELLLNEGFDINYYSSCGFPAVYVALAADIDSDLQQSRQPGFESLRYLIGRGANMDLKRTDGMSLTEYCALEGGEIFRSAFHDGCGKLPLKI